MFNLEKHTYSIHRMLYFCLKLNKCLVIFSNNLKSCCVRGLTNGTNDTTPTSTSGFGTKALPVNYMLKCRYKNLYKKNATL